MERESQKTIKRLLPRMEERLKEKIAKDPQG